MKRPQNMFKVSIVIPVYNVEKYLHRCVNSVLNQTISDIEILLVDDGSPDKCPEICDELQKQYENIVVIHKMNGGLSSARNAGISKATGEYIGFVDSDDDVEPNMYETLYNTAIEYNADIVMADYIRVQNNGISKYITKYLDGGVFNKQRIINEIYPRLIMGENIDYGPLLSVWQSIYKREFLQRNNIVFDEAVRWSEDNIFSAMAGYKCNRLVYLKWRCFYHYWENQNSITTSYKRGAWDVYCTMNSHLAAFFSDKTEFNWDNQLKLHMIYYALVCLNQEKRISNRLTDEYVRIVKSDQLQHAFKGVKIKGIPWKLRVKLILLRMKVLPVLSVL